MNYTNATSISNPNPYAQGTIISHAKTWHRGSAIDVTPDMDVAAMLEAAKLNWDVHVSPFKYGPNQEYTSTKVKAAYRSDTGEFLATYSDRKPWQNWQIVNTFIRFCEDSKENLQLRFLGSYDRGASLYAAAYLPVVTDVGQGDYTEWMLLLKDSHRNGKGLQGALYGNRLVCLNGMQVPVRVGNKVIAHIGEFDPDVVSGVLNNAMETIRQQEEIHVRLTQVPMTKAEAHMLLIQAFGDPNEKIEDQPKPVKVALRLFDGEGEGATMLTAYNTAYGLLQAVSEYYNWHAPARGDQLKALLDGSRGSNIAKFEKQLVSVCLR